MRYALTSIPNSLEIRGGIPRPDWCAISEWTQANVRESDFQDAWTCLALDWLENLIRALPGDYTLSESSEFMLVAEGDERLTSRILRWCERSRRIILDTLAGACRDDGFGKHVVLAFAETEHYYDYISDFYPDEGEFALSGGIFLNSFYGHFAICPASNHELERTIAHELNHALLRHLPLPLWLNEGVTQVIEDIIVGYSNFGVNIELMRMHRQYWNGNSIQSFWTGNSFFSPDDGQELSYHLSQVLVRNLMSDFPKRMISLLDNANSSDAGNAALVEACGTTLGDRVSQFLGEGDWELGLT